MISYNELKGMVRIDVKTGRAVIPEREWGNIETRTPDYDSYKDVWAVDDLYRRLRVIESMNLIIRCANNEDISMGRWLAVGVADGDKGLDLYDYCDNNTFFEISEIFKDIISDVKDIHDLVY